MNNDNPQPVKQKVQVYLTPVIRQTLRVEAAKADMSMSAFLEMILYNWCKEYPLKNQAYK